MTTEWKKGRAEGGEVFTASVDVDATGNYRAPCPFNCGFVAVARTAHGFGTLLSDHMNEKHPGVGH